MNKIVLIGRIVHTPELRNTPSGVPVCKFTLAVDRKYKSQSGEKETDFIDCVAWRSTAEFVAKWFSKGKQIAVAGSLETHKYKGRDGTNKTAFEVNVDEVDFCGSKFDCATPDAERPAAQAPAYSVANNNDFAVIADDEDLPF